MSIYPFVCHTSPPRVFPREDRHHRAIRQPDADRFASIRRNLPNAPVCRGQKRIPIPISHRDNLHLRGQKALIYHQPAILRVRGEGNQPVLGSQQQGTAQFINQRQQAEGRRIQGKTGHVIPASPRIVRLPDFHLNVLTVKTSRHQPGAQVLAKERRKRHPQHIAFGLWRRQFLPTFAPILRQIEIAVDVGQKEGPICGEGR